MKSQHTTQHIVTHTVMCKKQKITENFKNQSLQTLSKRNQQSENRSNQTRKQIRKQTNERKSNNNASKQAG